MKIAFFDCFSGISGDMCLGALVDAGLPLEELERELRKLPVGGFYLRAKKVRRCGIPATKVDVMLEADSRYASGKARRWDDVRDIIRRSSLGEGAKEKAEGIFGTLFRAEAKVHGESFRKVHLHELAAVDCLADVCGTVAGLELLGIERVYASPVNLGSGSVMTEHGILPVPAPATAEILKNVPVYSSGETFELTTPTGAAIVKSLSCRFGEMPLMVASSVGTGAGGRDTKDRPNVLRLFAGKMHKTGGETVTVIETNIDDMNPQLYENLIGRLFEEGALDVFMTQVIMKKMRPAVKLTALCESGKRETLMTLMLRETTSIGLRWYEASRMTMEREIKKVRTEYGDVRVKISGLEGGGLKVMPEYEDCRKLAKKKGIPLFDVMEEAKKAAGDLIRKH